jgi:hypothetical protein
MRDMPTDLSPDSTASAKVLPSTGSPSDVLVRLAYGIYNTDAFCSGAADQVSYVHGKLGGNILDIEIETGNVYKAYEEACLEYSYLLNTHQAKNVLSDMLGGSTGSFDQDGEFTAYRDDTTVKPNLKFPRFTLAYSAHVATSVSTQAGMGGHERIYSASFDVITDTQDYDLQAIIYSASLSASSDFSGTVGDNKIIIEKVYYKPRTAGWRFFGSGMNTNSSAARYSTFGQYGADSTFEISPVWQQELYASAYENALKVRSSHFSYELKNNRLRIFPIPSTNNPSKMYINFRVQNEPYEEESDRKYGADGINNINSLPFPNIPYGNINSIGKHWIRRFCLALCKETLGQVRSKLGSVPIPGNDVTLNGSALISEGQQEQDKLREELKTVFDELTYGKLAEGDQQLQASTEEVLKRVPHGIYTG